MSQYNTKQAGRKKKVESACLLSKELLGGQDNYLIVKKNETKQNLEKLLNSSLSIIQSVELKVSNSLAKQAS